MFAEAFIGAFIFVFIGGCVAFPLVRFLNAWLLDRTISGGMFFTIACFLICGMALIYQFLGIPGAVVTAIILAFFTLCSPVIGNLLEKMAVRRFKLADIDSFRRAIEQNPDNLAAREYLADTLMQLRRYEEAVAEYEHIVEKLPEKEGVPEARKLARAKEALERSRQGPVAICAVCDGEWPGDTRICPRCGSRVVRMPFRLAQAPLSEMEERRMLVRRILTVSAIIIGIGTLVAPIPTAVKIWILFFGAIYGIYLLARRASGDDNQPE